MNKNTTFKILRDIYHILSYASKEEIIAAAKQPRNSAAIIVALESLAEEADGEDNKLLPAESAKTTRRTRNQRADELDRILTKPGTLPNKAAIVTFAKEMGMKLSIHPKDGYTRVLSKFATGVKNLEAGRRSEVIQRLRGSNLSEIEGWISVIHQPKGK